jgi:hypothetical protein
MVVYITVSCSINNLKLNESTGQIEHKKQCHAIIYFKACVKISKCTLTLKWIQTFGSVREVIL